MPKIRFWNPQKDNNYNFIDKKLAEAVRISGVGMLVHRYEGPTIDSNGSTDTDITSIQDILFLENTTRKYNPDVIEIRGHYTPQDVNYDLSQFGIFLSSDVIRIQIHFNDMMDQLGRKLFAGDVLEFPNMRDIPVFDGATGINRYYVVQDAVFAASGYGQRWYPHMWLVRAKLIQDSPEYSDILTSASSGQTDGGVGQGIGIMPPGFTETADGKGNPGLGCAHSSLSTFCKIIEITDQIVEEAARNAFFDPKFFESKNLYIYIESETGYPVIGSNYFSGDGEPPNGGPLLGAGVQFPESMTDGQYYLRVDYYPERLYQKQGSCYKLIEVDVLKNWTAYNRVLDTFIDNNTITNLPDGTSIPEKQSISQVVRQKVDLYAEQKTKVTEDEAARAAIAANRAKKKPN
jgi:hypothetical protein